MSDPVLTDDEKGALLDGISSGEVEVHSSTGPEYAAVAEFEVGPRSRIVTNSYPRLQSLNRQFASRVGKQIELLLNAESNVIFNRVRTCAYSEVCEVGNGLSMVLEFAPKPLEGSALIVLSDVAVEMLVETFYGGLGNESEHQQAEFFTPGEISVATLFGSSVLAVLAEVWQPLAEFAPEMIGAHLSTGVISCIDATDGVIGSEFEFTVGDKVEKFELILPLTTVAPLVPVFDGQKRERDAVKDARWRSALSARVIDSIVQISSAVGRTQMPLRTVAALCPGDIFPIGNPQECTISAATVPILAARFGVQDGHYAVEASKWLEPEVGADAKPRL